MFRIPISGNYNSTTKTFAITVSSNPSSYFLKDSFNFNVVISATTDRNDKQITFTSVGNWENTGTLSFSADGQTCRWEATDISYTLTFNGRYNQLANLSYTGETTTIGNTTYRLTATLDNIGVTLPISYHLIGKGRMWHPSAAIDNDKRRNLDATVTHNDYRVHGTDWVQIDNFKWYGNNNTDMRFSKIYTQMKIGIPLINNQLDFNYPIISMVNQRHISLGYGDFAKFYKDVNSVENSHNYSFGV